MSEEALQPNTTQTSANQKEKIKSSKDKKIKNNSSSQILDWVKLDNAALIYPSSANDKWNFVFRVSVFIDIDVNPNILQNALNTIMPRFPHFNVCLRKGFFWYYFQSLSFFPKVAPETNFPCRIMEFSASKHIFRVLYYKNKISFEAFHSLTDGFGALVFMTNLIAAYYNLLGHKISLKDFVIDYHDKPLLNELKDPFAQVSDSKLIRPRKEKMRRRLYGTPLEYKKLSVITGEISVLNFKEVSRKMGVTITELIVASMFKAIVEFESPFTYKKLPLKISVPINARAFFPTNTTRNFSSYINIELNPEEEGLNVEEIAQIVKSQLKTVSKDFVLGNINKNVKDQKNPFVRIMPLPIKNFALNISYKFMGEGLQTSVFSNLGQVPIPKDLQPHIKRVDAIIGSSKYNPILLCGATVGDNMSLTFSSTIVETTIQKNFFRILSSLGIEIKIETNFVD